MLALAKGFLQGKPGLHLGRRSKNGAKPVLVAPLLSVAPDDIASSLPSMVLASDGMSLNGQTLLILSFNVLTTTIATLVLKKDIKDIKTVDAKVEGKNSTSRKTRGKNSTSRSRGQSPSSTPCS